MSKELETLKKVKYNSSPEIVKAFDIIEKALQRLEAIENAKPSEAIEWLETKCYVESPQDEKFEECCSTIKQALIKAQEQEKVLEIIKEKKVDVFRFKELDFNIFNQLQKSCKLPELTQEEFDLLKEVLNNVR